jgi:hypothetical protein
MRSLSILALCFALGFGVGCGSDGSKDDGGDKTPGKTGDTNSGSGGDGAGAANGHAGGSSGAGGNGQAGDGSSGSGAAGDGSGGSGAAGDGSGGAGGTAGDGSGGAGGTAGTSGGSGGSGSVSKPLSQLRDALSDAICDALDACLGESALRELTEREDCATRVGAQLRATDFAYLDQAVTDGRVLYNPLHVSDCTDDIRALECDVLSNPLPKSCADVLEGNVKIGGECVITADCEGAAFCAGADQCPSHCSALLAEGDACSGDSQCGADLMCVAGHCLRPSRDGEPCNGMSGKVCRIGFTCEGSTDVDTGMCVANSTVQVGNEDDECEPGGALCKEGLSCVYDGVSAFHCENRVASGADCHLGLPSQCPSDEYCDATEVTEQGTCRKLPGVGDACVLSGVCAAGLVCVSEDQASTCRAIQDNCGACNSDDECRSLNCDQGKCAPPPACGEASGC